MSVPSRTGPDQLTTRTTSSDQGRGRQRHRTRTTDPHASNCVQALHHASVVYQLCSNADRVVALTDELAAVGAAYEVPIWPSSGRILDDWAVARARQSGSGVTQIRAGLDELQAAGTVLMRP